MFNVRSHPVGKDSFIFLLELCACLVVLLLFFLQRIQMIKFFQRRFSIFNSLLRLNQNASSTFDSRIAQKCANKEIHLGYRPVNSQIQELWIVNGCFWQFKKNSINQK